GQLAHLGPERGQVDARRLRRHGDGEAEVLQPVVAALEVHALARRRHADDLDGLAHLLDGRRERQTMPLPDDDLARQPEAEPEPARGEVRERRRRLHLDSPRPSPNRPGARCASVAAACPYTIGVRVCTGMTPLAIRSVFVCVAISVDSTIASAPDASPTQAVRYPR